MDDIDQRDLRKTGIWTMSLRAQRNNQPEPSKKIEGQVVRDWQEFGHRFQIEKLKHPRLVGAGYRPYRLWHNGSPCYGCQWQYNVENALWDADYLLRGEYLHKIQALEKRIQDLNNLLRTLV